MIKNLKVSFVAVITFLFISVSVLAQESEERNQQDEGEDT